MTSAHPLVFRVLLVLLVWVLCVLVWMLRQWNKDLDEYRREQRKPRRWTHL